MTLEALVAAALLSLANGGATRPVVSEARADYLASAIVYAAGDDIAGLAAMEVNLVREGGTAKDVERCQRHGQGGLGAWEINPDVPTWRKRFPRGFCGPIGEQARAAFRILRYHWGGEPEARSFGFYLGAKERERHYEARERARLYHRTVWELENRACF